MLLWKRKRAIPRWLAGAVFLICALAMTGLLASEVTPRREQLMLEASVNGGEMTLEAGYEYGGALTLAVTLPEWESQWRPMLEVRHTGEAEVFLDGEMLGRMEAWDGKTLGNAVFMLPKDCAGKTVTLETAKEAEEPLPLLFLTDSGVTRETERAYTAKSTLPAAVFAVVSLLVLGLFFFGLTEGHCDWPVLLLGFAALTQAFYFHAQSRGGYILPPEIYGLWLCLSRAALFALPPLFLLLHMKKWRKLFLPFAILPGLAYFVVAGFQTVVPAFSMVGSRMGRRLWCAPYWNTGMKTRYSACSCRGFCYPPPESVRRACCRGCAAAGCYPICSGSFQKSPGISQTSRCTGGAPFCYCFVFW